MAFSFESGLTQYLRNTTGAPISDYPLSLGAWVYTIGTQGNQAVAISIAQTVNSRGSIVIGNAPSLNRWAIGTIRTDNGSASQLTSSSTTTMVQNQWQYVYGWVTGTTGAGGMITDWMIGYDFTTRSQSGLTIPHAGVNFTRTSMGGRFSNTIGQPWNGYIAEFAIWNTILNDEEFFSIARGIKADKIRPDSLVYYFPGIRENTVETVGGFAMTNINGASVVDHPRRYG